MGLKLLLTGGYFDAGGEGEVLHLDVESGACEPWGRWPAPKHLHVDGKGFAGGVIHGRHLYVAAHAAVVRWDLGRATVDGVLHQPDFNDLHGVSVIDGDLYVVNTGADAVDKFTLEGEFQGQWSFRPGWVQARQIVGEDPSSKWNPCAVGWSGIAPRWDPRTDEDGYHQSPTKRAASPFHTQKVPDRVHPNHIVQIGGERIVTCLYDGSFRRLSRLDTCERISGHPHDGQVVDGEFWYTTIDGRVWSKSLPLEGSADELRLDLSELGRVGWCRGLLVTKDLIIVALTQVKAGRLPKHAWADHDPSESVTGVVVADRESRAELGFVDLTHHRHRKLYSILEMP